MPRTPAAPEAPGKAAQALPAPAPAGGARSLLAVVAASALGCAVSSAIFLHRVSADFKLFYSDSRLPMLVEADGYHHLFRSQELLAGKAAWLQEPALSALGAALSLAARLPLELVAFWLPVGLAAACGLWFWGWGKLLGATTAQAALAAFAGSLIPAWFQRACPGWYDTDPGIAFLWHGSLFATACLGLAPGRPGLRPALLLAACALGLGWWWRPGILALPLCLLLWGATFAFAEDRLWRRLRLATGMALLLGGALFLLLPGAWLPQTLAVLQTYARAHAATALGTSRDLVFLSIAELEPMSVTEILRYLGGNAAAGALALCATLMILWRRPRPGAYLLPSLLGLGLAFFSQRLLYFAALPVALGLGLLPGLPPPSRRYAALTWTASLGLVASLLFWHATHPLKFYFQAPQDRLALTLKRVAPPEAKVWNWWDDGYFLAARSGHAPLFHGGSQSPRTAFIAAHPLASDDPLLASRWIRFFALRGAGALAPLRKAWGDDPPIWQRLDSIFSAQDPQKALARLTPPAPGFGWLFPEGRVFLYLPQRFLKLSRWWMTLGESPAPDPRSLRTHIDTFERTSFRYVPGQRVVDLPEAVLKKGYKSLGGVYLTSRTPLAPPWGGGQPGPYVVASDLSPWLYIVDEQALRSVAFRLLAPSGERLPGFAPVLTNYAYGGLWEVLP